MIGWGQNIIVQQITDLRSARRISKILKENDPKLENVIVSEDIFVKLNEELKQKPEGLVVLNGLRFWFTHNARHQHDFDLYAKNGGYE